MGSKLVKFAVISFPKTKVIGKSVAVKVDVGIEDPTITDLWEKMEKDGSLAFLFTLPNRITQAEDTVGWMGDFQPGGSEYTYLAGVLFDPGAPVPTGYEGRDIAACEMAYAQIQGTEGSEGGDLMVSASDNAGRARQENGYEYDGSNGFFEMEYYSYERFHAPVKRGQQPILDFYSPCKKAT